MRWLPWPRRRKRPAPKSKVREYLDSAIFAVVLFLILRTFLVQAFRIPSSSMESTLLIGDFLFITKFEYGARLPFTDVRLPGLRDVQPGDIIVFEFPRRPGSREKKVDFIKRCVAVAGQTVEMRNKQLYVDGVLQEEPYVEHRDPRYRPERDDFGPLTVPADHIFMLGDNRDYSHDSRFWGPLSMKLVHGRAFVRYFSWDPEAKMIRFRRILTLLE